ncbi:hypothetical protein HELRODRAFT_110726 [Helobdella robusta]|uniref:non-specific protein-tyrosine kinase n=1 Tax=Helobdella robusta TaxID=6412 RepID=T1EF45_HELRO|nr:hypothetical protein HELRODRAFT_110726 [Helobdella robusta]ESO07212.1 hypothetical protein HELRODRAFT_110726 [Helobdella robusta]
MCTTEEPIFIVMEYVANGSLQKFLRDDCGKTLTIHCLIDIAAQVANGMQYIESKGYIHRDLAARNVLIGENRLIKIADFGLSRVVKEDFYKATEDSKFPVKWAAIESIYSQIFTIKSDVWSFGILMVELLTFGTTPYPNMSNNEVQLRLQTTFRHPKPEGCSDELYEIMLNCWHRTPEKRPTFDSLFHILDDFLISTQGSYDS